MSKIVGTDREFLETVYADFWKDQTHKYGIDTWERKIIDEIISRHPQRCFEVGIGTGFPIATSLKEHGIEVDGCDVADSSVREACERLNREYNNQIFTGDLLELDIKMQYDLVYCVRSSWLMGTKHFYKVLDRMISITKDDGYVIFDFMDKAYKHLFTWIYIKSFICSFPWKVYKTIFKHEKLFFFHERYHNKGKIEGYIKRLGVQMVESFREKDIIIPERELKTAKVMLICKKNKI